MRRRRYQEGGIASLAGNTTSWSPSGGFSSDVVESLEPAIDYSGRAQGLFDYGPVSSTMESWEGWSPSDSPIGARSNGWNPGTPRGDDGSSLSNLQDAYAASAGDTPVEKIEAMREKFGNLREGATAHWDALNPPLPELEAHRDNMRERGFTGSLQGGLGSAQARPMYEHSYGGQSAGGHQRSWDEYTGRGQGGAIKGGTTARQLGESAYQQRVREASTPSSPYTHLPANAMSRSFSPRTSMTYGFPGGIGMQQGGLASLMNPPMEEPMVEEEMVGVEESFGPGGDEESIQVFMEAKEALSGNHPDPATALRAFVDMFGIDALEQLKAELEGGGDGMSDSVPGMIDGEEEVALSEGEFVVPSDAVSGMGNGSTDAGARRLMSMVDQIRSERTGSVGPANQIDPMSIMGGTLPT